MRAYGGVGDIYALAISHPYVIAAGYDAKIRVWNLQTESLEKVLTGHSHVIKSLAFWEGTHPIIVSASWDHNICIWSLETGQIIRMITAHRNGIKSIAITYGFLPIIVSSSDDKTIRAFDMMTGAELLLIDNTKSPIHIINVAATDGLHHPLIDPQHRKDTDINDVIIAAGCSDNNIKVWNRKGTVCRYFCGHQGEISSVAFATDTTGNVSRLVSSSADMTCRIWDLKSASTLHVLRGHQARVSSICTTTIIACNHDKKKVYTCFAVSCSVDGQIQLWDVSTGQCLRSAFSSESGLLVCTTEPLLVDDSFDFRHDDHVLTVAISGRSGCVETISMPLIKDINIRDPGFNDDLSSISNTSVTSNIRNYKMSTFVPLTLPVLTNRSRLMLEPQPPVPYGIPTQHSSPLVQSSSDLRALTPVRILSPVRSVHSFFAANRSPFSIEQAPSPIVQSSTDSLSPRTLNSQISNVTSVSRSYCLTPIRKPVQTPVKERSETESAKCMQLMYSLSDLHPVKKNTKPMHKIRKSATVAVGALTGNNNNIIIPKSVCVGGGGGGGGGGASSRATTADVSRDNRSVSDLLRASGVNVDHGNNFKSSNVNVSVSRSQVSYRSNKLFIRSPIRPREKQFVVVKFDTKDNTSVHLADIIRSSMSSLDSLDSVQSGPDLLSKTLLGDKLNLSGVLKQACGNADSDSCCSSESIEERNVDNTSAMLALL